ncbi:hypothetical protein [Actinoplanes sp. NBRC 103695]|uniref:hypothetical protein n=1 Tax=Actinoplanes sp. NBRC 103695 TaxID=3032202 RepID=UPI0024A582BC|nr:hypothetical protein [Actinoplanes sp. NBRC 103695]GLY94977.1 hypothetical protein Acsp02_22320 [Actinoplanes sp. NBRC 103695]
MKQARLTAALLLLPLAACVVPSPVALPSSPHSADPAGSGAPPTAPVTYRPALCDAARPASHDPFPYNRDAARRDGMLQFSPGPRPDYSVGGTASFENLDAGTLAILIEDRYIDPDGAQNLSPEAWDIFQFLCGHPDVRAAGYTVAVDREDYRVSIEAVYAEEITSELRADAESFCAKADEVEVDEHLECFWD